MAKFLVVNSGGFEVVIFNLLSVLFTLYSSAPLKVLYVYYNSAIDLY